MSPSRPRRFIALLAFAACATAQAATVQVTVLARDGQPLADAVVLIEPANATSAPTPAPVQARIDQERMQFAPMLTLVPTGSTLRFTNLDRWEHHVRMLPAAITFSAPGATPTGHELRLAGLAPGQAAPSAEITVREPGAYRLGCHLHGSMRGFVYVTDSPWAARTDADGRITLQGVPEGAARLRIWHGEQLVDEAARSVTLGPVSAFEVGTGIQPRRRR